MHRRAHVAAALVAVAACGPSGPGAETREADLVVVHGRVWTGVPGAPLAEAVAVRGASIVAVGSDRDVGAWVGAGTRVVNAGGGFVTPGFVDSHVHLLDGGFRLASVQLRDAATPEEFARRIAAFARTVPAGTWITGGDWDHQNWGGELPQRAWIDAATRSHPVFVSRLDGHMALANSAALAAAGVNEHTADVAGGSIVRDEADGSPTGVLKDNAMSLVFRVVPDPPPALVDRALDAALQYLVERGVTAVHDMADGGTAHLDALARARATGRLKVRVYAACPLARWEDLRDRIQRSGRGDDWVRIGGLKGFVDGSLGSHTAAFDAPFDDAPDDRGFFVNDPADLERWITGADAAGLQVMVHAIGDRANATLLDIFERVAAAHGPRDRRARIEHAQHLRPADVARFAAAGVIPSMQPYHAIDDGRWAESVIGAERARTTYAFRALLDAGAVLAFGSDWFVAPPTPLEGLYAAVTRRTLDDAHPGGWVPEQRITLDEALRAYTFGGAYASFFEDRAGTLESGKLADLVVLDRNLFELAPQHLCEARIMTTIVGGAVVYER